MLDFVPNYKDLNNATKREHLQVLRVDDVASKMNGINLFSSLDATLGFRHLELI